MMRTRISRTDVHKKSCCRANTTSTKFSYLTNITVNIAHVKVGNVDLETKTRLYISYPNGIRIAVVFVVIKE